MTSTDARSAHIRLLLCIQDATTDNTLQDGVRTKFKARAARALARNTGGLNTRLVSCSRGPSSRDTVQPHHPAPITPEACIQPRMHMPRLRGVCPMQFAHEAHILTTFQSNLVRVFVCLHDTNQLRYGATRMYFSSILVATLWCKALNYLSGALIASLEAVPHPLPIP
jgi:hypothetical protein